MTKQLLARKLLKTGYGTHTYDVKYKGEWEEQELINAVDNACYKENPTEADLYCLNYGGAVTPIHNTGEIKRAEVRVYYD